VRVVCERPCVLYAVSVGVYVSCCIVCWCMGYLHTSSPEYFNLFS
jgi:hypothetical protein